MALTDKLTNIANAIREKGGTTEPLTLAQMPDAIAAIQSGGGDVPLEWSGNLEYWDNQGMWDWYFQQNSNRMTTSDITNGQNMFYMSKLTEIPFDLNFKKRNDTNTMCMFQHSSLEKIGTIRNLRPKYFQMLFNNAKRLRELPKFEDIDFSGVRGRYDYMYIRTYSFFTGCLSLRKIDKTLLEEMYNEYATANMFDNMFQDCSTLDEIDGLSPQSGEKTSNDFNSTFSYCYRLKTIKFKTQEDGTPYTVKWKNQTIDLSQYVGWAGYRNADKNILNYNSGITAEDEDNDWSNNPNYWSKQFMNSRFNHDSAVNLINSLPDASAYLATQSGGTNTIKFYTNAGSATPGGGVNALTEEEIAVAAAKGWTITYGV